MGLLVDGIWQDKWYDTDKTGGRFERSAAQFRNWVTADGSAGPQGKGGFRAEPGRYHLYVSLACPWAHRTLIFRELKGLQDMIDVSVAHPLMLGEGWTFETDFPGATGDRLNDLSRLYELYLKADDNYSGRVTVPVLWDRHQQTIASNESADIIRMFNSAFDEVGAKAGDYYPAPLRDEIDEVNSWVYDQVNNGVYKAGFATSQEAYDDAVTTLFDALDRLEQRLSRQRYLVGEQVTEADWRLFTTLVRFDPVYVTHFKCDRRRISDYPNLMNYVRDLYQTPGVAGTVNLAHIRNHYFRSHPTINKYGILPIGPEVTFDQPHDRGRF
ncbi:putative glutathione S-transferase [Isoalcanivorax pacificus W11-5]|uniref:Putative glutathione S-transferase n=1 Tax=Isoalcanivorax pacificus W11-5 TaxID=391936 RepID=A0A0B4XU66_9GAMM|nr:glutathione S-transferase family protein [Isoalcanivorax pacificus]AJD50018.1 putative glutathione S-transferase [Isoalcanivorax pacificus W11-5]